MKKIYKLFVLAVLLCCGTSLWAAQSLPYSYGFEDYDLSTDGWTKYFGTSLTKNNNECAIVGDAKKTGSYGFRFSSYNTSGANAQYLISPELDAAAGLDLTFWYKVSNSSGTEKFKVGYSTTDADVANFTWGEENSTNSTSWLKFEGSFPAGTKYVAIYYYANYQYRLYVDDFEFVGKAEGPALQVLDGLTKITSGHNYSFGLATAGTVKMFTMNNPGTEAATITVSHTGDFTVTPSTTISIPAGESSALAIYMPETSGSDVITISSTAEGIDNFVINVSGTIRDASKFYETLLGGSIPEDWTTSGGTWSWSTTNGASNTAWYETSNYRLITPQLIVAEGEKFFFEAQGTYDGYQGVKFEYSADGSTWTASATETAVTGEWQTFEINDVPAGKYYIALHGWHVNIRNFYGGTLPAKVKDVAAAGVTDTEATISWTAHGSETAWQVSYSTTSGNPNNGTIVDAISTSKVLEGLSATTTYYVSVRIGDSGEWSNEISFKTGCAALSGSWSLNFDELASGQIPECWDNSGSTSATYATTPSYFWTAYKYSYTSDAKMLIMNNTMIQTGTAVINTPRIELPASPAYEFNFEYSHRASCGAMIVKVSEDNGDSWNDLQSYTNETGGTAGVPAAELIEASIDLTSYAGKTIMLQFYAMADYGSGAIFVDNVAVRVKSNCALPKNVTVSSITDHTASVAWTQKGEVSAWKLQTSTDGENWGEEIEANANPFTLSGLNAETTYYVRVKAACGESEYSDWSDASAPFTTLCEAKTLPFATEEFDAIPYTENFDDLTTLLPECWARRTEGDYPMVEATKGAYGVDEDSVANCLVFKGEGEQMVILPAFDTQLNGLTLEFFYKLSASSVNMEVCYLTSLYGAPQQLVILDNTVYAYGSAPYQLELKELPAEALYLAIRYTSASQWNSAHVDNISLSVSAATALGNTHVQSQTTKRIENGVLILEYNGTKFDATGRKL